MSSISLMKYSPGLDPEFEPELQKKAISLIKAFWLAHNDYIMPEDGAKEDLDSWTAEGHAFYFIKKGGEFIGFAHLGSRGEAVDWLEDLLILPEYQGNGFGSEAVALLEDIVMEYSESMYIEVAARNQAAARLYRKLGYDVLNTVTLRKDFHPQEYETLSEESISGLNFVIRKFKK